MGSSICLVNFLPELPLGVVLANIIMAALLLLMSKLQFPGALQLMSRPRRYRRLLPWAVLAALLIKAAFLISEMVKQKIKLPQRALVPLYTFESAAILALVMAVLLLNF